MAAAQRWVPGAPQGVRGAYVGVPHGMRLCCRVGGPACVRGPAPMCVHANTPVCVYVRVCVGVTVCVSLCMCSTE